MAPAGSTHEGGGGRYTLLGEIGAGASGTVHLARLVDARGSGRVVAIKRVAPELAGPPEVATALLDQVRLVARVRHAGIVPLLDVVRDGGDVLLVMEYVDGASLASLSRALRERGEDMDVRVACAVLVGVLSGLHAAHEAKNEFGEPLGVVHGALSPRAVRVGVDGHARVGDFGFGAALALPGAPRDGGGERFAWRAPEQVRGGTVTRQSDVWAAGVLLWEALAGHPLFAVADDAATAKNVVAAVVPDLSEVAPRVPRPLETVVRKALARAPGERYATARAMAVAIEQAISPAMPAEVSEHLRRLAGDAIDRRASLVLASESAARGPGGPGIIPSSEFIADALWGDLPKAAPRDAAPMPVAAPRPAPPAPAPAPVPVPVPAPAPALARAPAPSPPERRPRWPYALAAIPVLGALVYVGGLALVPSYARGQAIAAAAARGVALTIGEASGGYSGVHFGDLSATVPDLPGAAVRVSEADVELVWFRPVRVRLARVEVTLDGPLAPTLAKVAAWYRGHRSARDEVPTDGLRIDVPATRLAWTHAIGRDGRIDADGVAGEIAPRVSQRLGDELHFTTARLTWSGRAAPIGPWRVDVEQDPDATTVRVAFDPPVPDGPNAILTRVTSGKTLLDVNVPRSPLSLLGFSPLELASWKHAPEQAEGKLHYARGADGRVDASLSASLYGVTVPGLPGPTVVRASGSVGGDGASPLDLVGGALTVGPVKTTLTGPIVLDPAGVRGNLAWKAAPIACADLLPRTGQAVSDLASQLGALGGGDLLSVGADVAALAQAAGVTRTSGNLVASGTLAFDTAELQGAAFTATAKNSCGVAILGGR